MRPPEGRVGPAANRSDSRSVDRSHASRSTIYALSSGGGIAAVAVVRVSGPAAGAALRGLAGSLPVPRQAALRPLRDPRNGTLLDRALVLWFPGPHSFTGDDVAEFHVHGGRAVIAALLRALEADDRLRPAEPGEFTRRAFQNGKLDLTSVEGLADLLHAETEAQRRQAILAAEGGLRARLEDWRGRLLRVAALIEAELDFADEDDVPEDVGRVALADVPPLLAEIEDALAQFERGARIRDGFTIVLAGQPNAGKSSLLNALARREVAIVSAEAGTTRDLIEVHLDVAGYSMIVVDTAGLRESGSAVEQEGVRRALERAASADLVLWLSPADSPAKPHGFGETPVWTLVSKADLLCDGRPVEPSGSALAVSAATGAGLEGLLDRLQAEAAARMGGAPAIVTRGRQRYLLDQCAAALRRALASPDDLPLELLAEDVRAALTRVGELTGRVDVEQLFDVVFGEFCIGK